MSDRRRAVVGGVVVAALAAVAYSNPGDILYPRWWPGYGCNPQHTGISSVSAQPLMRIRWSSPVDLDPQYSGTTLYAHYGSPTVTPKSTVVFPVKTGANDGFRVEGRAASDGALRWMMDTDYSVPPHDWFPSCGVTLSGAQAVIPAAGGTVLIRSSADAPSATVTRRAFFGIGEYNSNSAVYNATVYINTPITADGLGNFFFGFIVTGSNPANLSSGIARLGADGSAAWIPATTAAASTDAQQVPHNCAPAINVRSGVLYVAVRDGGGGWLVGLNSRTLAPVSRVRLYDPSSGWDANVIDDGTASPTVGPSGDVYYGVLENPWGSNHLRGWMLHFDGSLSRTMAPGAFGWDDTVAMVPRYAVPGYSGPSAYLVLTKYNNYVEGGGDGVNKVAVLDPGQTQTDPITGATVMREVLVRPGPTPDWAHRDPDHPDAVREWCINAAAVDPAGHCAIVNNEDGMVYRWDFNTNSLTEVLTLTAGIGEAYTPTVIGPDGTVFAINNATLFGCGR